MKCYEVKDPKFVFNLARILYAYREAISIAKTHAKSTLVIDSISGVFDSLFDSHGWRGMVNLSHGDQLLVESALFWAEGEYLARENHERVKVCRALIATFRGFAS